MSTDKSETRAIFNTNNSSHLHPNISRINIALSNEDNMTK